MKDIVAYNFIINKLSDYFRKKNYLLVPTQSRLSILAACEDPDTISTFYFAGEKWPLPQTGQMWLEYELLSNPEIEGVYCISTSYRDEKNPIEGRHDKIFPMFEFEGRGNIEDLKKTINEILKEFNFIDSVEDIYPNTYNGWANKFKVNELTHKEEEKMPNISTINYFPENSHPFWNMKYNEEQNMYNKIDTILFGMETIGAAERETDKHKMKNRFHNISDGNYKRKLYKLFGKKRVNYELEEYLSLPMTPRYGAGIGVTRLAKALDNNK